ncbi:hypothetical protein KDA_51390 [Dictyobacter alpinus]|uniref:Uncharacterized protein n=1 Tax=Dictyobacter alpinus TaxID=2014873 RepID=A0A402BE62_9CHLR|nr:hypothetical protein KDA_51390 [Dictyobacter alpinus]
MHVLQYGCFLDMYDVDQKKFIRALISSSQKHDVNIMFWSKKACSLFSFFKPALEAFDIGLEINTKLL